MQEKLYSHPLFSTFESKTTSMKKCFFFCVLFCLFFHTYGQSKKAVDLSTDILMFVNPVAGFVGSLSTGDYPGCKQLILGGATNLAATYILKYSIRKKRPDHSDHHAFPSTHTSVAFQGAAFLQQRYGWKFGLPAYAISTYVSWGRIYTKNHDIWDVLGGAALGAASGYIFTRPFAKKHELSIYPTVINDKYTGISLSFKI